MGESRRTRPCLLRRPPRAESRPWEPSAELKPSIPTCLYSRQLGDRQTDRQRESQREKESETHRDRERERGERKRYTEIAIGEIGQRETEREGERDTQRQRERDAEEEKERQTDKRRVTMT